MMDRPHDPFRRCKDGTDRTDRIVLLGEFAHDLLAGRKPSLGAILFVAGAISTWLENGGSLEKDHLKVVKPKSHVTPSVIWRRLQTPHPDEDGEKTAFDKMNQTF